MWLNLCHKKMLNADYHTRQKMTMMIAIKTPKIDIGFTVHKVILYTL